MKFSLHIGSEISLENFSFSQLILMIKELFEKEGLPGFVKVFMQVVESKLIAGGITCKHCGSSQLHGHSKINRRLKTSVGEVVLSISRYRCQACKKTFSPLNALLDLDPYARKSREFEKLSLETVTEQSFRRSSDHLEKTLGVDLPHTTLHGWFMKTTSTQINVKKRVESIIADGTGYKMKPNADGSNRGEVRVVIGLTSEGDVIPYGAWTRASWKDIGKLIKKANHPSEKIKFKPIAETLITDGEEELVRALASRQSLKLWDYLATRFANICERLKLRPDPREATVPS